MGKHNTSEAQQQENAPASFQSVLRLRPPSKKEQVEEHVVLEQASRTSAVLHPLPPRSPRSEVLSPSSALVMQTLASDQVETSQDSEFSFDTVFPPDASQDKVYFTIGHTMAQSAMEPLKSLDPDSYPIKTNLLIAMGLVDSGKSYSCWGDGVVSKRKAVGDGLVPRVMDCLFSQSNHHVTRKRGHSFAVNVTFLQIDQSKSKSSECTIHDLMQPVARKLISIPHTGLAFPSPPKAHKLISPSSSSRTESGGTSQSSGSGSYSSFDETVLVEQDPNSSDCFTNGQVRKCFTVEEARLSLQAAMINRRKLNSKKKYDSHVLAQMQPIIVNRSGDTVWKGGRIAVLDMASLDHHATSGKKPRSGGIKDAIPNRANAHTAVLHCLRSIQNNQDVKGHGTSYHSDGGSPKSSPRRKSLTKVPYLRHKVTMLLQPLFSANYTDHTLVTLFLASSTGHREHMEKTELLRELQALHRPPPTRGVVTGTTSLPVSNKRGKVKNNRPETKIERASDTDDEHSVTHKKRNRRVVAKDRDVKTIVAVPQPGGPIEQSPSMTYSDSSNEEEGVVVPLPPPVAPGYKPPALQKGYSISNNSWTSGASAPFEDSLLRTSPAKKKVPVVSKTPPSPAADQKKKVHPTVPAKMKSLPCSGSPNSNGENESPGRHQTLDRDVEQESGEEKFSYMKTLNKVVCASKKKSRQVLDKMTTNNGNLPSDAERVYEERLKELETQYEERVKELETKNAELKSEIDIVREKNESLVVENEALKRSPKQEFVHVDPVKKAEMHENDDTSPAKPESMFDNPLFAQMAQMSNSHW